MMFLECIHVQWNHCCIRFRCKKWHSRQSTQVWVLPGVGPRIPAEFLDSTWPCIIPTQVVKRMEFPSLAHSVLVLPDMIYRKQVTFSQEHHGVSNHQAINCLLNRMSVVTAIKAPHYSAFVRIIQPVGGGFLHKEPGPGITTVTVFSASGSATFDGAALPLS